VTVVYVKVFIVSRMLIKLYKYDLAQWDADKIIQIQWDADKIIQICEKDADKIIQI
jgi:hypothetical protein